MTDRRKPHSAQNRGNVAILHRARNLLQIRLAILWRSFSRLCWSIVSSTNHLSGRPQRHDPALYSPRRFGKLTGYPEKRADAKASWNRPDLAHAVGRQSLFRIASRLS